MALFILGPDPAGNCCDCSARASPCDTCEPVEGGCFLHAPVLSSPPTYDNITDAQSAMDFTAGCFCIFRNTGLSLPPGFTLSASHTDSNISIACFVQTNGTQIWFCVTVPDNSTLTANYTTILQTPPVGSFFSAITVWTPDGNTLGSQVSFDTSGSVTSVTMPAGTYYIELTISALLGAPTSTSVNYNITCSTTRVVNPIIAFYDDSGTTRRLEACPKLLLPPLTKCSGDTWYESLSAAQAVLANGSLISNCVAYQTSSATGTTNSFSVSSANPSNIALLKSNAPLPSAPTVVLLSVSLLNGNTLSLNWNFAWTQGTPGVGPAMIAVMTLTDCAGIAAEDESPIFGVSPGSGSESGTLSLTAPYTGNFNIIVGVQKLIGIDITFLTAEFTATLSSPSMTVNPIQALYATTPLLDCPARLDC